MSGEQGRDPEPSQPVRLPIERKGGRKLPISCFVITKNEADNIERCVRSVVDWVDEVIVVDCGSSDGTVAIARAAGARVVHNDWPGFGPQKRFAEDQCRNHWVLNLDADEWPTADLQEEIRRLFERGEPRRLAFSVKVHIVYPGRSQPRPFALDHECVRLYDRRKVRYRNSAVHDRVDLGSHRAERLQGILHHRTFSSFDQLMRKCYERANYGAVHSSKRSSAMLHLRAVSEWPLNFVKYYFFRRHFTAGSDGLKYAVIMAHYRLHRILCMLVPETQTATDAQDEPTVSTVAPRTENRAELATDQPPPAMPHQKCLRAV